MTNRYSIGLMAITVIMLSCGGMIIYTTGNWLGLFPFVFGFMMLVLGWKQLKPASPKQVALITFFGVRTTTLVRGTVYVLDWIPLIEIVGLAIFDIKTEDEKVPIEVPDIKCSDNVRVTMKLAFAFSPDISDDPDGAENWKSAGEKLGDFDDVQGYAGASGLIKTLIPTQAQRIANNRTSDEMERGVENIGQELQNYLEGVIRGTVKDSQMSDDLRGMGIKIKKCAPSITLPEEIVKADNDAEAERRQKAGDKIDVQTMNELVDETISKFIKDKETRRKAGEDVSKIVIPSREKVWKMVDDQRLLKAGKRQKIEGGNLVNFNQTGGKN